MNSLEEIKKATLEDFDKRFDLDEFFSVMKPVQNLVKKFILKAILAIRELEDNFNKWSK